MLSWKGQGTIMIRPYLGDVKDSGLMPYFKWKKKKKR